jgi:hypothetical protein
MTNWFVVSQEPILKSKSVKHGKARKKAMLGLVENAVLSEDSGLLEYVGGYCLEEPYA